MSDRHIRRAHVGCDVDFLTTISGPASGAPAID